MNTPAYEIATEKVSVPTIISREMGPEDQKVSWVCIQCDVRLENGGVDQLLLPVECVPSDDFWRYGELSSFHIVFVGMVRDWPQPEAVDGMIKMMGKEMAIAWVIAPQTAPYCPILSCLLSIPLPMDQEQGLMIPVDYRDEEGLSLVDLDTPLIDQIFEKGCLLSLPPEIIPWGVVKEECDSCSQLQHSHSECSGVPPGGDLDDLSYICPVCRRRWWQYNNYFRLWKHVTDPGEWDSIRRQDILLKAGYVLPEQ